MEHTNLSGDKFLYAVLFDSMAMRVLINWSGSTLSSSWTNFFVGHTVTAGNGINPMDVVLSSKVTTTGRSCQFVQMLWIVYADNDKDNEIAIIHHNLEQKQTKMQTNFNNILLKFQWNFDQNAIAQNWKLQFYSPFDPMTLSLGEIAHSVHRWVWTKLLENCMRHLNSSAFVHFIEIHFIRHFI